MNTNMPPSTDTEADPGESADQQAPTQDPQAQEQAISVSLNKEEAVQLLQLIASIGEQLDSQLKQMEAQEQGAQGSPGGPVQPAMPPGAGGPPPDVSNGMSPQAAALQQMLIARQKK